MKVRFGQFDLDSDTRQLVRAGEEVHLSPKAFAVLSVLLDRRPNVVAKADLFGEIWPDVFVVDGNLNVLVGEIRRALDDDPQSPRFIRTVHGVGYAFCGHATDSERPAPAEGGPAKRFWLAWSGWIILVCRAGTPGFTLRASNLRSSPTWRARMVRSSGERE